MHCCLSVSISSSYDTPWSTRILSNNQRSSFIHYTSDSSRIPFAFRMKTETYFAFIRIIHEISEPRSQYRSIVKVKARCKVHARIGNNYENFIKCCNCSSSGAAEREYIIAYRFEVVAVGFATKPSPTLNLNSECEITKPKSYSETILMLRLRVCERIKSFCLLCAWHRLSNELMFALLFEVTCSSFSFSHLRWYSPARGRRLVLK